MGELGGINGETTPSAAHRAREREDERRVK